MKNKFITFSLSLILFYYTSCIFFVYKAQDLNYSNVVNYLFSTTEDRYDINKLIIVPFKKVSKTKDISLFIKELIYFFHRVNFDTLPFNYIIFENGFVYKSPQKLTKKSTLINEFSSINIFLIYEDNFNIDKYKLSLSNLFKNQLANLSMIQDFKIDEDIVIYNCFEFYNGTSKCNFINRYDLIKEELFIQNNSSLTLDVVFIDKIQLNPDNMTELSIQIYNYGSSTIFFNKKYFLESKFLKDSLFYVQDEWPSTRTWFILNNGGIEVNDYRTIKAKVRAPLLPGSYTEEIQFNLQANIIAKKALTIEVPDIGQKVLQILPNNTSYINIYEYPNNKSSVIGKIRSNSTVLYIKDDNNYYLVNYLGKTGWVSKNEVKVLKDK